MSRRVPTFVQLLIAALYCAALAGCAQVRVPAIDPTGSRLLAPYDTTLANPLDSQSRGTIFPRPAFTPAPAIPACPQPIAALPATTIQPAIPILQPAPMGVTTLVDPCATFLEPECPPLECYSAPLCPPLAAPVVPTPVIAQPVVAAPAAPAAPKVKAGGTDALTIAPARVVAGVGTEVVFRSLFASGKGGCGKKVEWVLAEGSVGHLIDVGGDVGCDFLCSHKADGQSGTFKVGKAIKKSQLLTRNLADPRDDILLAPGESWVSVTSPTEGVSYVSALSPDDAPGWDPLRQAATVFWIDAQWALPQSVSVASGGRQLLTTNLRRASTGAALPGWIVRYSIAGGAPAGFLPAGAASADVPSDANGAASVEIAQASPAAGATHVRIQVIRPLSAGGNLPELTVGEGAVQVSWSAPGLAVNVRGPTEAKLGDTIRYEVEVSNPGDMTATGVVLTDRPPPGLAFVGSDPPAAPIGERLEWNLGDIPARMARVVMIEMQGAAAGDVRHKLDAQTYSGLAAEGSVITRIVAQTLSIKVTGPPSQQAEVGETVVYDVDVTNLGNTPLDGVTLTDRFDAGLRRPNDETSPLSLDIGRIEPGQTRRASLEFIVDAPGQLTHVVEAISADGQRAIAPPSRLTAMLAAPAGQPDMQVRMSGPPERRQGEVAEYQVEVANNGDTPLTNVRVAVKTSPSLFASEATNGHQSEAGELVWTIRELAPQTSRQFQVNCNCLRPDGAARSEVTVTCDENITLTDRVQTRISSPVAAPAEPDIGEAPGAAPIGVIKLTVDDNNDPARVGQEITYTIRVKNDRNVNDREVALTINIPTGLSYKSFGGQIGVRGAPRANQLIVNATPIQEMRPEEELVGYLTVTAIRPGMHSLVVRATSERSRTPVEVEASTTVFDEAP